MKRIELYTAKKKNKRSKHIFPFVLFSFLALALTFASCKKTTDDNTTPVEQTYHLNVSQSTIQAPSSAGTATNVTIDANADWTVTMPTGVDWLEVNKTSGTGNDAIQVKLSKENTTASKRTTVITVALVNGKAPSKQISIEQDFVVLASLSIDWKKLFGGNGNDYGYSIIKATDGGYLLSGRTTSNNGDITTTKGGIDMWVAKLDAAGALTWQKSYGGSSDEYSVAAAASLDGGYVLTGFTLSNNTGDVGSNHGNTDFWVIKINATGTLQWQKTLGGTGDDRPNAITVTIDGRIAVAGFTNSNNGDVSGNHGGQDMWVVVLDNATGNLLAKKTLGGGGDESAKALAPAADGGLYIGGTTATNNSGDIGASKGNNDFWVCQLDHNLSIVWKSNFGGSNNEDLNALAVGPNNTLIAAGSTKSNNNGDVGPATGSDDMWIIRVNATNGALLSQKVLGGNAVDVAKGLLVRPNGTIAVAGYTYSNNSGDVDANHGSGEFWVVGLSANNSVVYKKTFGGDNEDLAFSIAEGAQGFAVAGYTLSKDSGDVGTSRGNSDIWVVKLKDE
ncbi:MAG: hypothetical protein ACXVLF_12050 [Flavisolibacter sp.]